MKIARCRALSPVGYIEAAIDLVREPVEEETISLMDKIDVLRMSFSSCALLVARLLCLLYLVEGVTHLPPNLFLPLLRSHFA